MLGFGPLGELAFGEVTDETATALTAATGSYALTFGNVITAVPAAVDAGSFVLTFGNAVTAVSLPVASGSYTLTGNSATLTTSLVLVATPFIDTDTAQFGFSALGEVGLGDFTDTYLPTFRMTWQEGAIAVSMPVSTGLFTLTGFDSNTFVGNILNPATGMFALTWGDVVTMIDMPVTAGYYTLTGFGVETFRVMPQRMRAFSRPRTTLVSQSRGGGMRAKAYGG